MSDKKEKREEKQCAKCGQNFLGTEEETECDICSGKLRREDI